MIKKHLGALIDVRLIVFLVIVIAVSFILTMVFNDKVKDFVSKYKRKFYIYVFSFVLIYALVAFLGYNKLFTELSDEFLFYQIASLLFGILNVYLYRFYLEEFYKRGDVGIELLLSFLITLYSSVLFIIIYTALNGITLTFLMCSHFLVFMVPTGVYAVFNYMMQIPPRTFVTWTPKKGYAPIESYEMEDILLITLLIRKEESDEEYASIRAQAPLKVDFGRLFYLALKGYNKYTPNYEIEMEQPSGENYNWVFFLQPKWYQRARYVDAAYYVGLNGITENSVIICQRVIKKNEKPNNKKKKVDEKVFSIETLNEGSEQESKADSIEGGEVKKVIK
ncbi:hypothetical protein KHA90_08955 [Flavobacterium psychroterrae]|uniref:TssN family type VI secretion system protein n=1 Tax=Flavobacterium psychroterrae TaxID=2133767 RepID=A0ABS5PA19_9FLAO|nr:TssN family type VI secretion system protein [Flavobacterium psychroterrae]MBS7231153.1 hypothetical protein [Flavobacterium psychroterrae]